jgi:hypothetical protein
VAHRSLRGGMARPCAARSGNVTGWSPRAARANLSEPSLSLTVLALSTRCDGRQLVESSQMLPNGRIRRRGMPLSEKMLYLEPPLAAARRGFAEELGLLAATAAVEIAFDASSLTQVKIYGCIIPPPTRHVPVTVDSIHIYTHRYPRLTRDLPTSRSGARRAAPSRTPPSGRSTTCTRLTRRRRGSRRALSRYVSAQMHRHRPTHPRPPAPLPTDERARAQRRQAAPHVGVEAGARAQAVRLPRPSRPVELSQGR